MNTDELANMGFCVTKLDDNTVQIDCSIRCERCEGTGLQTQLCPDDISALVCEYCHGKGTLQITEQFTVQKDRKPVEGVTRVHESFTEWREQRFGNFTTQPFGLSYEEWVAGKDFPANTELREMFCPEQWIKVSLKHHKPQWKCDSVSATFTGCPDYANKQRCWEMFDREQERLANG